MITKNYAEGFHYYSEAPDVVLFLQNAHRHTFHIECGFDVEHDDRHVEIFIQQDKIQRFFATNYGVPCDFGAMSCEMIAKAVITHFNCSYVKVTEDGEGGAIVQR